MNNSSVKNIFVEILEKKDSKDISVFQGLKNYRKYYITEQLPGQGPSSMSSMTAGGTGGKQKSGSVSFGGGAGVGLASPRPRRSMATDPESVIAGEPGNLKAAGAAVLGSKALTGVGKLVNVLGAGAGGALLGRFGPGLAGIGAATLGKSLGSFGGEVAQSFADLLGGDFATKNALNIGRRNVEAIASLAPTQYSGIVLPSRREEEPMLSPEEERRRMMKQKIEDAELQQKASALGISVP